MVMPSCNSNGKEGYFPMKDAYDEGGYEARSSKYKAGIAELLIEEGKDAIDAEFARILPVVRAGGYIVGNDHQVPPSAPLELYKYYIERLKDVMAQAGADL